MFISVPPWVRHRAARIVEFIIARLQSGFKPHPSPLYDLWVLPTADRSTERALLAYTTLPFRLSASDPRNIQFSNIGIARSIVRVLNVLGYVVDVVDFRDGNFRSRRQYDVFVGHGGHNFEQIARSLSPDAVKIYFSTGCYWRFHNAQELARLAALEERRGVRLHPDRLITASEEWANLNSDAIICLGNESVKATYSKFPTVFNLNNAAYHDGRYDHVSKDFVAGRRGFLFFSGPGSVHKGLDLLIEAFVQVDAHLYVCQDIRPEFYDVYGRKLRGHRNIHLIGRIQMRCSTFYELVDSCNFVISPSCSEGSQGAIVECMHQGLIPVASRITMPKGDYGIALDSCSVDEIAGVVRYLSQCPPDWCQEMSRRTREATLKCFSEAAFLRTFRAAVEYVITERQHSQMRREE